MNLNERFRHAARFALKHLAVSGLIAGLCAALVFFVWYPYPFDELASGRELFALLISVDVVIGPMLSLVVFNPEKATRRAMARPGRDLRTAAVGPGFGLHSVTEARPVWLAFEGDRFRVVALPDLNRADLAKAPDNLSRLRWTGPKPLGVKVIDGTDPEFLKSIGLAMEGIHPAFRPQRWVDYELQRAEVIRQANPFSQLKRKRPQHPALIDDAVRRSGLVQKAFGYLPLDSQRDADWIVAVSLKDGHPSFTCRSTAGRFPSRDCSAYRVVFREPR